MLKGRKKKIDVTTIKNAKSANPKQKTVVQPQKLMSWSLGIKKRKKMSEKILPRSLVTIMTKKSIMQALTLICLKPSFGLSNFHVNDQS